MELSLIHAGLAAGVALAALPVILHLFMRQTPKHVIFPALRLVRERQKRSKKRMRIKNWLLLLARMAVLALMALALARPRLYSQVPLGDESVPTALGLVFDTSLSMGYKEKDKSRLDEAKERAGAILDKLPDSSLVFLVDSAEPGTPQPLSPAAARKWIADRKVRPVNRPLNAAMGQVYPAVAECDRPYHEVYVLTDLARSSWNPEQSVEGLDRVEKARQTKGGKLATFILRIGAQEVDDVAIDLAEPAASVATQGEPIEIKGRLRNQGTKPASRVVEFYLDGVKKDQKPVEIAPGAQVEVSFATPARLPEGDLHRGELRLAGAPDPLEFNDRRYFTFKVRPALQILLISDLAIDADFVAAALDPDPTPSAPRSFDIKRVRPGELLAQYRDTLKNFAAVFLLNIQALDEESWGVLNGYVHEGGGLVVGLGDRCRAADYNGPTAGQLLPAQLKAPTDRKDIRFGKIADVTHPLFARYPKELATQLAETLVYRYWAVTMPEGTVSRVLLSFADGAPSLIERSFKGQRTGRVLLWTTPLARRYRLADRAATWNEFPLPAADNWSFLALMNESVRYLAGAVGEQFNYEAGENVSLALPPGGRSQTFLLTGPDTKTTQAVAPSASSDTLEIIAPQILGQWAVAPRDAAPQPVRLGFSLNPPGVESQLTPLQPAELDRLFGKDSYALAEDAKSLQEKVTEQKIGRELFPYLMMLILLVVTLENFLANTFYKESARPNPAGAAA
ncbi:MAG: BatA domain-containing protein [Isosphaeraceae bacterium]